MKSLVKPDPDKKRSVIEKNFREWEKKMYPGKKFPINCEFCKWVGGEAWHCKCHDAPKFCINVFKDDVCDKWTPNEGLMTYFYTRKVFSFYDFDRLKEHIKLSDSWDGEGQCKKCKLYDNLSLGYCGNCYWVVLVEMVKILIERFGEYDEEK